MKRIAIVFRGRLNETESKHFPKCIESHKSFFGNNQLHFFGHVWSNETLKEYGNILSEQNSSYTDDIKKLIHQTRTNKYDYVFNQNALNGISHLQEIRNRQFAQLSSAISIENGLSTFNPLDFDVIILSRPDIVFDGSWDNVVPNYNTVLFNKHGPYISSGDFVFVFNSKNYTDFSKLYTYYKENISRISPQYHFWFYYYVTEVLGLSVKLSNIEAGINCQLIRDVI
jgi:hypothetical protein